MRPLLKKILVLVLLALVAGFVYFLSVWFKPHRDVKNENAVTTTANELLKAFVKNERELTYLDKAVQVSGEVLETKTNQEGKTVCYLKTDDPFGVINCTFKVNTTIATGQQLTVTGICTGYLSGADVVMIDCYIAPVEK